MNKNKIFSSFLVVFMLLSMMCTSLVFGAKVEYTDSSITPTTVFNAIAKREPSSTEPYTNGKVTISGSGTAIEVVVTTKGQPYKLLTLTNGSGTTKANVEIDPSAFKSANNSDVIKAMKIFVDGLKNCGGSDDVVRQLMEDIQAVDPAVGSVMLPLIFEGTKGDMYEAYKITSPFLNILSVILGVGAVILIILLLFSTVMDLAYIGLPVWREAQAEKNGGKKHPFGVSYEAMRTVQEVEQGLGGNGGNGEYRNAYLLYFKRRALTYIILAICIMYLICGGLSGIIGFVLSLVSGITG